MKKLCVSLVLAAFVVSSLVVSGLVVAGHSLTAPTTGGRRAAQNQIYDNDARNIATTIQLEPVLTTGLSSPVYMTNAHDGTDRLFIVEQGGRIKVLQPGATTPTIFLNISTKIVSGGEQGLLGLAFHPQYRTNRRFFVNYTRAGDGATVIAEYHVSTANPNVADTAEIIHLTIAQPFTNHNGGMIEFGPDGYLYIGMGDGGSSNDPGRRAQNVDELLGKMLRIDVDTPNGAVPYSSPPNNPFFGTIPGRDEIYTVGMRNPFRWSFDRATGQLWAGDVGQGAWEEIDIITLGANYGWRVYEGFHCTNLDASRCAETVFTNPVAEYGHTGGRCSITGGYVYRGTGASLPVGLYIYGDYCTGEIFLLENGAQSLLLDTTLNISSFGEDEAGEIYVVNLGGALYRVANPGCPSSLTPTARTLPQSGGAGRISVGVKSNCRWTAQSNDGWISLTQIGTRQRGEYVKYEVKENTTTSARSGAISVAGRLFVINQAGISCAVTLSDADASFAAAGGAGKFGVSSAAVCTWSAVANANWIHVISSTGSGEGVVRYSVDANTGGVARSGTITVDGQTFTVQQGAS
ncbi:MAG: PQQ-dependent sugar dehydrogenase [Pyrinomonadaceae bacterium]